jgi:hypothetical protein
MTRRAAFMLAAGLIFLPWAWSLAAPDVSAQRGGMFLGSSEDPAIAYTTAPLNNAVSAINERLRDGSAQLTFDGRAGYLRSALRALEIPVESQVLVFSQTSFQRKRISDTNPRALFFNDRVALGWVRDGEILEVAAQDAREGMVFYTLDQRAIATPGAPAPRSQPEFKRVFTCLACHMSGDTLGVPGMLMFSTPPPAETAGAGKSVAMDHRSPIEDRWGGWYVTGSSGSVRHLGNQAATIDAARPHDLTSVSGLFDGDGYQSMSSDIAALLVLSHQTHMTNLLTRVGWEARAADPTLHAPFLASPGEESRIAQMMDGIASEVVDYLLFVDEAPLADRVQGSSGFAQKFAAAGPRDRNGRSLHELDLGRRLMRYPCSYLIYSEAFAALPPAAKDPIYRRMWTVLSGEERGTRYQSALSLPIRQQIVEILRDTKNDLPAYFQQVSR